MYVDLKRRLSVGAFSAIVRREAGGGGSNVPTGPAFGMVIDEATKSTDNKFGVIIRAIQDDMTLLGDAEVIFGTNGNDGALEFFLSACARRGRACTRPFKIQVVCGR